MYETSKNYQLPTAIKSAFTLVELAIVLVIIGLLAGGVMAGRELIDQAKISSQITQLNAYTNAVNTFKLKYNNFLPGDIREPYATRFGFTTRGTSGYGGQGDGNGILWGSCQGSYSGAYYQGCGESVMFFVDLSRAGMIAEKFTTATPATNPGNLTQEQLKDYYPEAKIGNQNLIYTYSDNSKNYFGISIGTAITGGWRFFSSPGFTVNQTFAIDTKLDDGKPLTGKVINQYLQSGPYWGIGAPLSYQGNGRDPTYYPYSSPTSSSCMDHGNVPLAQSTTADYAYYMNNEDRVNCGLSMSME